MGEDAKHPKTTTPVSTTLGAARALAGKAVDGAGGIASAVSAKASAHLAAGLAPVRDLGRSVEGSRIAVEASLHSAVATAKGKARRTALGFGLHGANLGFATGEAALAALLLHPFDILETGAKFIEVRRDIADALVRYDEIAAAAAQAERERLAQEAVARLAGWDHRTTRHRRSDYLHVSTGPGRLEAWGMVLRGPHAGRSLAALSPVILAELLADVPDEPTAAALQAWQQALAGAAAR